MYNKNPDALWEVAYKIEKYSEEIPSYTSKKRIIVEVLREIYNIGEN